MKSSRFFTTGELAKLTGISKQLLIFYDKQGIFPSTETGDNGYRQYSLSAYFRLKMLLSLRKLDLPLDEICGYLNSCDSNSLKDIYERKIEEYVKTISLLKERTAMLQSRLEKMAIQETQTMSQVLLQELSEYKTYIGWRNETRLPVKERISHIAQVLFPYLKDPACLHDSIQGYLLSSNYLHTKEAISSYVFLTKPHPSLAGQSTRITLKPGLYAILRAFGYHGMITRRSRKKILDFLDRNQLIPDDHIFIFPDDCTGMTMAPKWKITIMVKVSNKV